VSAFAIACQACQQIERLIDEWAGTHDLDDSDFDDHSDHENDSHISISSCESEEVVPSVPRPKTVIVCAVHTDTPAQCHNAHGANNFDSHISISGCKTEEVVPSVPRPKTAIACTVHTDTPAHCRNAHGANNFDILNNLSQAFNLEMQRSQASKSFTPKHTVAHLIPTTPGYSTGHRVNSESAS